MIDKPYSTGIFETIVNCHFGVPNQQWLLGKSDVLSLVGSSADSRALAENGLAWGSAATGASGLGRTVVSLGAIAFGFVRDQNGDKTPCFMRAGAPPFQTGGSTVYMGVLANDSLLWQSVWQSPGPVNAISFAKDAFFITYSPDDFFDETRLAVTRDGVLFSSGIRPLPAGAIGSNVAYNKTTKQFATVGSKFIDVDWSFNFGFVYASSSDGVRWSPGGNLDPYGGIGAGGFVPFSTVAAGNGIFVAAAGEKHSFPQFIIRQEGATASDFHEVFYPVPDAVLHKCAVAVSTDGSSWSVIALPGAKVSGANPVGFGDTGGDALSVAFIENDHFTLPPDIQRNDNSNAKITGFFVAVGVESHSGSDPGSKFMMWKSETGYSWSKINETTSEAYVTLCAIAEKIGLASVV